MCRCYIVLAGWDKRGKLKRLEASAASVRPGLWPTVVKAVAQGVQAHGARFGESEFFRQGVFWGGGNGAVAARRICGARSPGAPEERGGWIACALL